MKSDSVSTPGEFTGEMQEEMDRLESVWEESIDFDYPPNDEARKVDHKIHSVWNIDMPEVAEVRHFEIPGDTKMNAEPCEAVVFRPEQADDGTILYIHGGGWCFCNLTTHERFMRVLANSSGKTVVGVHYRLAPENPFPAGLNDVISAYRCLLSSPKSYGLTGGPLVIAGDSAGANLALATMLHEIKAERPLPVGALLFYGAYGLDFSTPSYSLHGENTMLPESLVRKLWNWYLPEVETHENDLAVPMTAPDELLKALPPLFLMAAELDPLASDTLLLKERLDGLGRSDSIWVEPGVVHAFLQMTAVLKAARSVTAKAANAANQYIANAHRKNR